MVDVHVLGTGMTTFGRSTETLLDLIAAAAEAAMAAVGDVGAIIIGTMAPEEYLHEANLASQVADRLGLSGIPAIRIETASSSGAAAFHMAVEMVAAGRYRRVLVVAGEKMTHVSTSVSTQIMSQVLDRRDRRLGLSMPAMAALVTTMYAREHGISRRRMGEALAAVAIKNHANGALNPHAQLRRPITEKEYFAARLIASPLRLFDCAPISDGAAAVVVGAQRAPVRIVGIGQATDRLALCERRTLAHFSATRRAAAQAYEMAGFGPRSVTFAEVHDAFTPFELLSTEDLGLLEPGTAVGAVLRGQMAMRGPLPINPSGGLKARGHPIGASGLAQIVELVWQMHEAVSQERRVPCADIGLALSIGGPGANNFVTLLQRGSSVPRGRLSASFRPEDLEAPSGPLPQGPPRAGRGRILAQTQLHVAGVSTSLPAACLAVVQCAHGARFLARVRTSNGGVDADDRVRFAAVSGRYRAERIDRLRRARIGFRQLLRRLSARARAKGRAASSSLAGARACNKP